MALDSRPAAGVVFFERREIDQLLRLYGRMVAAGEWRDYGMAGTIDHAVFSVFRHAAEAPLYRIEKRPALARKQGEWAVIGQGGLTLKRGHDLGQVLRMFDKGRFKVSEVDVPLAFCSGATTSISPRPSQARTSAARPGAR
jgi:hypothetical protein